MEEKIEASEILRHWSTVVYGYAAELQGVQEHSLSWTPCDRLVAAAHDFWLAKGRAIGDLLTESQKVLGFEDPLTLRFDLHRWLAADREEAYSDWLAWIANELALPELVGRLLLGNDIPAEILNCNKRCVAEREKQFPGGRLDCLFKFGDAVLVVIEVKLTTAESADLGALPRYKEWSDAQGHGFKFLRLLVTDSKSQLYDGFEVMKWKDVCANIRRLLPELVKRGRIVEAALCAAFVGAVEMNLLGLPSMKWVGESEDEIVWSMALLGRRADEVIEHLRHTTLS
jgi:hypothetical protein